MTAPTSIDQMLPKARVLSPEYTDQEMTAAVARLEAKAADRIVTGAITFDDATFYSYLRRRRPSTRLPDEQLPTNTDDRTQWAVEDLEGLCHLVISQPDALHTMTTFICDRILEPAGARVLACVLHLAGREESARFWWQYAAGADDIAASYCLYLHHMTLGETEEAEWWQDQVTPLWRRLDTDTATDTAGQPGHRYAFTGWASCLQIVARHRAFTDATTKALAYIRNAVQFVDDDLPLPLPDAGFAQRIEEITALV